jgi:glycerol uptake facilitator-like aquaporin
MGINMNMDKKKLGMEFFGVMVIVMVANSGSQHPMLTGLTAGLMYTMAMGISGGHLNPAITIGLMATKKMDAREGGQYIAAQILGAMAAFLMADIVLNESIASAASTGGMTELWQDMAAMTFAGFILMVVWITTIEDNKTGFAMGGFAVGMIYWMLESSGFAAWNPGAHLAQGLWTTIMSTGSIDFSTFWIFWIFPTVGILLGMVVWEWFEAEEEATETAEADE